MFFVVICVVLIVVSYVALSSHYKKWEEKGVPYKKPIPLIGNLAPNVFQTKSFWKFLYDLYNEYPNDRYFGVYQFLNPTLVIRDPDLIKQITVKNFDHFMEHRKMVDAEVDHLWASNLLTSNAQQWKEMRPTLSPAFTSSKMKLMFSLMVECAEEFVHHFAKNKSDVIDVELKETFTRFTNDVIATTAFGLKCDSLNEKDNKFYLAGQNITNFSGMRVIKFLLYNLSPLLMKIFKIRIIDKKDAEFFSLVIKDTIRMRTEKGLIRPDMIHLLLEARKGKLKHEDDSNLETGFATVEESHLGKNERTNNTNITDEYIIAQALGFFVGGFDTTSVLMCGLGYELAINSDIQERLYQEIMETNEKCHGKITYEALMEMKYMDMVISEVLRKWPPLNFTDRKCTKSYTIFPEKTGEKSLFLEEGTLIWIPIYGIHRDPKYYPNPDKFDPERFSDENKNNIKPYTFIPFGAGPRNCIGSRFAIMENKIIFYHILKTFEIVPTKNTSFPIVWSKKHFNYTPVNGWRFGFKKRNAC